MDNISINSVRPSVLYYFVNESSKASKLVHGSFFPLRPSKQLCSLLFSGNKL